MTVTSKPLVTAQFAANAETTYYTATGVRTIVDKCTGTNTTGAAVSLTVRLVPSGGTAGAANLIETASIGANSTYTFPGVVGHTLEASGFISALAGAASSVVLRVSGREVSA
jgi:hypothetical protein